MKPRCDFCCVQHIEADLVTWVLPPAARPACLDHDGLWATCRRCDRIIRMIRACVGDDPPAVQARNGLVLDLAERVVMAQRHPGGELAGMPEALCELATSAMFVLYGAIVPAFTSRETATPHG